MFSYGPSLFCFTMYHLSTWVNVGFFSAPVKRPLRSREGILVSKPLVNHRAFTFYDSYIKHRDKSAPVCHRPFISIPAPEVPPLMHANRITDITPHSAYHANPGTALALVFVWHNRIN